MRTCGVISVIWSVKCICLHREQSQICFFNHVFLRTCAAYSETLTYHLCISTMQRQNCKEKSANQKVCVSRPSNFRKLISCIFYARKNYPSKIVVFNNRFAHWMHGGMARTSAGQVHIIPFRSDILYCCVVTLSVTLSCYVLPM